MFEKITCLECREVFGDRTFRARKYCSRKCSQTIRKPRVKVNCKSCEIDFIIPSFRVKYRVYCSRKCHGNGLRKILGEKHPNWKGDEVIKNNERNDSAYHQWVVKVKRRDNNQCRIKNESCLGYKIVHHILPWRAYPEERYNINNGITLCQFHHPRKRKDEQRLTLTFQELVNV